MNGTRNDEYSQFRDFDLMTKAFRDAHCTKILVKRLAENDNSKNQIYFGPGFEALNIFPNLDFFPSNSGISGAIYKSPLKFYWLDSTGKKYEASNTKIILYPQYPEVRFSAFLSKCEKPPSKILADRLTDRILFLGITEDGKVIGHVVHENVSIEEGLSKSKSSSKVGVFQQFDISTNSYKSNAWEILRNELERIHRLGWIDSKRLNSDGKVVDCRASNCGGYTLEAELGVRPNGISEPDFHGWEIKSHKVGNFTNIQTGVLTLMTPEPSGGLYKKKGVIPFINKYGYKDRNNIPDRRNFGGIHRFEEIHPRTNLQLKLLGYDKSSHKITASSGSVALVDKCGRIAASWDFGKLLKHWNRKHARAAYVPRLTRTEPSQQYEFGKIVRKGVGTDFGKFLLAVEKGIIYYDPGIKVENISTSPKTKKRSQFRIKSRDLEHLYSSFSEVDVAENPV
jgi:hypothetical protein